MPPQKTDVKIGAEARKYILAGVNIIYEAVRKTLGPEGRNALLPRTYNRGPRITNDGVTISDNILPKHDHIGLSAEAFREGSKKTNELVGDGTTTTALIAGFLINKIFNELSEQDIPTASLNDSKPAVKGVRALRKDMKDAKDLVLEEIKAKAKPIKTLVDLEKIARISIGKEDEDVSKVVAQMVWDIARDADGGFIDNFVDVTEGYKQEIETEVIKGMRFPAKVAHRSFITTPERFEMVAEDVTVFITNFKLDNPYQVVGLLDSLRSPKIALFAPDFSPMVIKSLQNTVKGGLFCYPVKCPALRTVQLEDLAVYTGATVIDKDSGRKLENVTVADLGFADKIVVKDTENKEDAVLLGGKGEKVKRGQGNKIDERCAMLKKQMNEARNELTKKQLERRIANLSSGVGVVRVGATTDNEGLYLKKKIEDGVYACKAALQEGYVEGGGLCLRKIAEKLPHNVLTESLQAPFEQIQKNAGGKFAIEKDVIDPAKVVRLEVEHGVSVAATMITTDISIPEIREKAPAEGYEDVANALKLRAKVEAKHHGLLKENEDFQMEQMEDAWEESELMDND